MLIQRKIGTTSEVLLIFIQDSTSTTGAGKTGLAYNTASLTAYYVRNDQTSATAISLVDMTLGTYTSGGFKEVNATTMPGWYQFCPPNAVFTSGRSAGIHLQGASGMAPCPIGIELTATDNQDGAGGGMSNLDAQVSTRSTFDGATGTVAGVVGNVEGSVEGGVVGSVGSVAGNIGGNVLGGVVGAVGSVTGNVGGNVVGSVGSITGVTFPANFSALGISASGHVLRVVLVDTASSLTGYTSPLDAAGTRAAVGLAAANLDTTLATLTARNNALDAAGTRAAVGLAAATLDTDIATLTARNNPLDAVGIRAAVGLAAANLEALLNAIGALATSTDGKLPADTATKLARLDVAVSAPAVIADGTLTPAKFSGVLPANFAALLINVFGHVSRVTLVDTTTTGGGGGGSGPISLTPVQSITRVPLVNSTLDDGLPVRFAMAQHEFKRITIACFNSDLTPLVLTGRILRATFWLYKNKVIDLGETSDITITGASFNIAGVPIGPPVTDVVDEIQFALWDVSNGEDEAERLSEGTVLTTPALLKSTL